MKRKSLLFLLLMALFMPWAAQAQTTVEIGTDGSTTTNSYLPAYTTYNNTLSEQIYTAEEVTMAGTISSISFYNGGSTKSPEIKLYLVNTDKSEFTSTTDWLTVTADDLVFDGTVTFTAGEWTTIAFDNEFAYDGTSNLGVVVDEHMQWSSGLACRVFTSTDNCSLYHYDDNVNFDATNPASGNYSNRLGVKNQIKLEITPSSGMVCEKPESLEATNVTENGATLTWTGGSGNYNVEYKLASETEWTSFLANTTATTCNLTGLTPGKAYQACVQSVCGDATSGWKTVNFTTACGAITTFPWTETFESYASGDFVDPCWVNEHIEGSGTYVFRVSTSSNEGNTTHQLQLPDMAIGTLTKLVLPEMNVPANHEFSIDIYRSSSTYNDNYPNEGIRVYASTNGEIEGATELAFIPRHYQVSNDVIPAETATGWYTYELPIGMSGTCYIILRGESQYCTATYMDNFAVKAMPTCIRPTGLAVTANSVTAHNATITWTENGEASTWIVEFATDADFTDVLFETVEDTPTYTFVGLEPETTYYVRVKAQCGPGDESEYSNEVNFTTAIACPAPTNLTVNPGNYSATVNWKGTSDSYIVSYRTAAYADGLYEEFNVNSVPSGWTQYTGRLDGVLDGSVTLSPTTYAWSMSSYAFGEYNIKVNIYSNNQRWLVTPEFNPSQNLSFDLALTDFNNSDPIENNTLQADDRFIVLIYANDAWHILREWNNSGSEYVYNAIPATGENVSIDLSAYYGQNVKIAFYGESTNPAGMDNTGGDNDMHIDNVFCGTPYPASEWQTITVSDTTATIPDLTSETTYEVKVQGNCGELDGVSLETAIVTFTTLEGCPVPQDVEVDNITYNSATVTWDGYNDSYNVSYRMAAHADGVIEPFDVSGVPAGWTKYSGLVDQVVEGTADLATTTSGWNTTSYALGTYNMKVNIWGASVKYWLVTPEFKPSQDLSFDLALTRYNSDLPIANDSTAQLDDRFIVLVYADNAWHILREWNNSGSEHVYNAISATGESVNINLSAYYDKKVKIAFYGESTESGGDNDMHIDNIVCGTPVEAGEWETVEANESPFVLTGLTPETPYEVKVQGVCGETETEWTEIATFTTLEAITYTLTIEGYEDDNNPGGYYLIASPVTVNPADVEGMTTGEYDLYSFDQAEEDEWRNYKQAAFNLEPGKGYLYAHKVGGEFTLVGTPYSGDGTVELVYDNNATNFQGWNLVGNPFAEIAYLTDTDREFYTLQNGADVVVADKRNINPMEGIFVIANENEEELKFTILDPLDTKSSLVLNLNQGNSLMDRAIVRFGHGGTLPKFQLRNNSTKIYIPVDNQNYAVVRSEGMGEMPVSFKAENNGTYTLSFNAEEVSFAYLHLIDNMTGVETDLLETPSYSFEAKSTDYANRFKLVFATGNNNGEDFAFFSNGSFVINNEGDAMLQVVDVTGRIVKSESINGCANVNVNGASGVYMLRLVNGDNVKVQKVVVR